MRDITHLSRPTEVRATGAELPTEFLIFAAGENASTKGGVLFDKRAAQLVLAAAKEHGVDFVVDLEHFSLFGTDPDARGWFHLALRNGELWAVDVTWTDDGAARLRSRRQRYISPAFFTEPHDGNGTPRVRELVNCALCAQPSTHHALPLVASRQRPSDVSTPPVSVRLPAEQRDALARRAQAEGVTVSSVARDLITAGLYDFEVADAAKIEDPEARARFAAKRRQRHEQALAGLTPEQRRCALQIADHGARARFVAALKRGGK